MKISSLLREAPGTPTLSLDQDLMQRAMLKFPGYDKQQALSLYMADKLNQQQKIDASQNNLINTQRSAIQTLQGELDANEDEVERIKQLTARVTAGSADTRQKAKVSGDELEKLQKQLEELKDKPNLDPKQYKEMEAQIMALASNPSAENTDVKKLQSLVNQIDSKATINYDAVYKQLQSTQEELDSKEQRFQKSINKNADKFEKNASEFRKYADIVDGYKEKIDNFDNDILTAKKEVAAEKNAITAMRQQVQQDVLDMNNLIASTKQKANIDWLPKGDAANQGQQQLKLAEENSVNGVVHNDQGVRKLITTKKYIDWKNDHIPGLYRLFKLKYEPFIKASGYSDKQIQDMLILQLPKLFNVGDDITPLTPEEVGNWMDNAVIPNLEKEVVQYDVLRDKNLSESYSHMLNRIINLSSIKRVKKS
jgi:type I site-specific restriction endonuclease